MDHHHFIHPNSNFLGLCLFLQRFPLYIPYKLRSRHLVRPLSLSSLSAQLWPLAPSRCRPRGAASGPSGPGGPGGATTGRGCSARTAMASRRRLEAATATANRWCQMLGAFRMPQCATRESPYWIHNAIAHGSMR